MQINTLYNSTTKYTVNKAGDQTIRIVLACADKPALSIYDEDGIIEKAKGKGPNKYHSSIAPLFAGKEGELLYLPDKKMLLVGIGSDEKPQLKKLASLWRKVAKKLTAMRSERYSVILEKDLNELIGEHNEQLFRFAVHAFEYVFCRLDLLTTSDDAKKDFTIPKSINFTVSKDFEKAAKTGIGQGQSEAVPVNRARQIASLPGNHFEPADFEKVARKLAKDHELKITVLKDAALEKENMGGILAVSRGSALGGRLIALEYRGNDKKNAKTLVCVGKGLTFDTGGISLKPPPEMHEMKYDMCGAAAVLFAMDAVARLKLKINMVTIIASAENMPGSKAIKPGDVYTSHKGLTVEVQNTDAEGRLVLADALAYSEKFKPDYIVDFATLTGAILIALGDAAAGLFGNDGEFNEMIKKASGFALDPVWEMPMWPEYAEGLKSDIADVRNIGGRLGSSISAAKFLEKFVPEKTKWAHFDIAGTAWVKSDRGMLATGATGMGVRLVVDLAREIAGARK